MHKHLSNNKINKLASKCFQGLSNVIEIKLNNNQLMEIDEHAFERLSKLDILDLSNNKINKLVPKCFQGLSNLETIILNNNELTEINQNAFVRPSNVKRLDLSINSITFLSPLFFNELIKLEYFNISFNNISQIEINLKYLTSQKIILNISSNEIRDILEIKIFKPENQMAININLNFNRLESVIGGEHLGTSINVANNYLSKSVIQELKKKDSYQHFIFEHKRDPNEIKFINFGREDEGNPILKEIQN